MDLIIKPKSSFKIIGLQLVGNSDNKEFPKLWERLTARAEEVKPLAKKPIVAYGVCSNFNMETNIFDYTAGLEVEDNSPIPEGMVELEIPIQDYAVFPCTLPTLMETIQKIYNDWLPNSEYKRANGPEFELYEADFDPNTENSTLYLYIPVEKK